jgi:hypothetical protein
MRSSTPLSISAETRSANCSLNAKNANREALVHHQQRADPHHGDPLQPEQQPVQHREQDLELARGQPRVHRVDHAVHEARLPIGLPIEQLDRLHGAQRLEEVAGLLRLVHQRLFGRLAQRLEEGPA